MNLKIRNTRVYVTKLDTGIVRYGKESLDEHPTQSHKK